MSLTALARTQEPTISNPLQMHDLLIQGTPVDEARLLQGQFKRIKSEEFFKVLGIHRKTFSRRADSETARLDANSSDRLMRLRTTLTRAADVLGCSDAAEDWVCEPAIGLNNRRPIELLETSAGYEAVTNFLVQIDYGVYA